MSTVARPKPPARSRLEAERRLVIRGARWDDYIVLVDSLDEHSPLRVAFDGKEDTTEFIPWLNRVTKWARRRSARRR